MGMSTAITLVCMSALAGFVYYYIPRERPRKRFRLEQFRPAAPLVGILDEPESPESVDDDPTGDRSGDRSSARQLD